MFKQLSVIALTACLSKAIMIPPDSDGTFSILPESSKDPLQRFSVDPYTHIVKVDCAGPCPLAEFGNSGLSWAQGQENYLVLNISVSSDSKSLLWNGAQFFPPKALKLNQQHKVLQVPGSPEESSHPVRLARPASSLTATSWSVRAKSILPADSKEEIIDLHLSIHSLEQQRISIHDIVVGLVKDKNNDLMILASGVSKEAPAKLCSTFPMLCQWRGIVTDKVDSMRQKMKGGCRKHHGGMMHGITNGKKPHRPHYKTHHHGKPHHHAKPHHHKSHYHHHHQHVHGFLNKAARVMLTVVIPLLLGVLAGMLTYLIGMLVGTGLAMAWIRFRRYRRGEYTPIALGEEEVDSGELEKEAKEEYIVEEFVEAPPLYIEVEAPEAGQK